MHSSFKISICCHVPFLIPIIFSFLSFISQIDLPEVSVLNCVFKNSISSWIYLLISLCFCFLIHLFLPLSLLFFSSHFPERLFFIPFSPKISG